MRTVLYPRLRLDLTSEQLRFAWQCTRRPVPDATTAADRLVEDWAPSGDALVTLSVRSALELLLSVLRLPRGSEVMLSAVTIPDMAQLVREHGLVPVPVDIAPDTLFPTPGALERAWSPRARVLVVAHLLGGRSDLGDVAHWARQRGLLLVEDCAQGFTNPADHGSDRADLSCFSFGTIKTLTALGGALSVVRDRQLLAAMRAQHARWATQPVAAYQRRLMRAAALLAVQTPQVYRSIERATALLRRDFQELIIGAIRGFPASAGETLGQRVRFQPCAALLQMLHHRLSTFHPAHLDARTARGEAFVERLQGRLPVLGAAQPRRTHWLVGVEVQDRARVIAQGLREGFDLAGATNICALPRPAERPDLAPLEAEQFMSRMLIVPTHPGVPEQELNRLVALCASSATPPATPRSNTRLGLATHDPDQPMSSGASGPPVIKGA